MTSTGHKDRAKTIVDNLRRRSSVTNVTEVNKTEVIEKFDLDELKARDLAYKQALEQMAFAVIAEVEKHFDVFKADQEGFRATFEDTCKHLKIAAEAELKRHDKG